MPSVEEVESRMNQTKNILHKCALEGQINIGLMLSDIEYLISVIKNLEYENNSLHKEINRRIKLKIENEKIVDNEFISKNKIREKIKRLDYSRDNIEQRYFKKEVLQELLNDNHIPHID